MTPQRIAKMPDWPARMGEDLAALFLGISGTKFRENWKKGVYPRPVPEGGRLFWSRRQLESFVDAQFGTPHPAQGEGGGVNTWDDL